MLSHGGVIGAAGVATGAPSGTLLLGTDSTVTSANSYTGNQNQIAYMQHTAQASGKVATAYYYDRQGSSLGPIHLLIFGSSGVLLGVSPNITLQSSAGWRSVAWTDGPTLVAGATYYIGYNTSHAAGSFTNYDSSSPAQVGRTQISAAYGSESNITPGGTLTGGSYTIYVTA
jgi:hypothetical protein